MFSHGSHMSPLPQKKPKYSELQMKLINSFDAILEHAQKPSELKHINAALRSVLIREDDYQKVLDSIFIILLARPDVRNNPNFDLLEEICRHCAIKLGSLKEPRIKPPRSKY